MPKINKGPAKGIYAVHIGKTKGIYFTWPECEKQVKGVIGAKYKKFETLKDAEDFVRNGPKTFTRTTSGSNNSSGASSVRQSPYNAKSATLRGSSSSSPGLSSTVDQFKSVNGVRVSSPEAMVIYTDGSSLGNGKKGCQAGIGVFFGVNDPRNVSERLENGPQTNQRAELMAAYRALEACGSDTMPLEIRTDSMYTINVVTQWAEGWIKNNWKRSDGDKVQNRDIIEPLIERVKNRPGPVKWVHVKAHVGTFGNEMADRLANAGAVMSLPSYPV